MKILKELEPTSLVGTDKFDPKSSRALTFLQGTLQSKEWSSLPPVYTVENGDRLLVLDGNQRRNFAQEHSLLMPEVVVIETDADWMQVKERVETAYTKVTKVDQLLRLLRRRIEE